MPQFARIAATATMLFALLAPCAAADMTIVYLTRHAEKTADAGDPDLTEAGKMRAQNIAATLKHAGITRIYTTKWLRTRQTAAPLATQLGITPEVYGSAQQLAAAVKAGGGKVLVVGHSNTLPDLVNKLGGKGGADVDEMTEFDRLYQLIIAPDGSVTTTILRSLPAR